jgi:hypothetical protein
MNKPKKLSIGEWIIDAIYKGELSLKEILEQAKEMDEAERQKKRNQFVLNMPFNIEPLTREIGTISDGFSQTEIKNVGYVIKDAKGVEYFFYEKDGELVYDGWCAGFPQTKED